MKKTDNKSFRQRLFFPRNKLIGLTCLAILVGLSSFIFIFTVNNAISSLISENFLERFNHYVSILLGSVFIYFFTRRLLVAGIIKESQRIHWEIRKDIIRLILNAPYKLLVRYKSDLYSTLTADINNITNVSFIIVSFISSIILIVSCLVYMAVLSFNLFAISIMVISIAVLIYFVRTNRSNLEFFKVRELENTFNNIFNSILLGAKEIKVNRKKGEDIYVTDLTETIDIARKTNTDAYLRYLHSDVMSQLFFYLLVIFIIVCGGQLFLAPVDTIVSFVFVLLFLLGPVVNILSSIPAINRAIISEKKIIELWRMLCSNQDEIVIENQYDISKHYSFKTIEIKNICYTYEDNEFELGPIDLLIKRNDITFISGGNGQGKTTLLNLIVNLYDIDSSTISIDGVLLSAEDRFAVKNLFSPIFNDFYLFEKFYGIERYDHVKALELLRLFELDQIVSVSSKGFSTTKLSTGQRKRLALINALLENRPILILDEWAADQDPLFRKKFYEVILPLIVQKEDKTVIAITHDDNYYHFGTDIFKMDSGKLFKVNNTQQ